MDNIRILIVDDNPSIHIDFNKIFGLLRESNSKLDEIEAKMFAESPEEKEFKFIVDSAFQGEEALQLISKRMSEKKYYSIAFVDIRMPPGMDGVETTKQIWLLDGNIQVVICTAYSDYSYEDLSKRFGTTDRLLILKKPFENIEVLQLVNTLAKKWKITLQLQEHLKNLEKIIDDRTAHLEKLFSFVRATLEATTDGIMVLNSENKITDYNKKLLKMLNFSEKDFNEVSFKQILNHKVENGKSFFSDIKKFYEEGKFEFHNVFNFKDGRILEYFSEPQFIKNKIVGIVICFRDITENKRMEKQLIQKATHDSLTGVYNRLVLFEHMKQAILSAKRSGKMVGVIFIDLDHFKRVNDSFGHDVGDLFLKTIAKRLHKEFCSNATLARVGGDEFVIVIPDLEKIDMLVPISQKVLQIIEKPLPHNNDNITITGSLGISIFPKDGNTVQALIKNADAAHRAAKEIRDTFNFFTVELNINARKRLSLESHLRQALEQKEFSLHYQPIVCFKTGKIVGVEALLRWQHPKLGLIPPQEFVPIADETGLILPIGDWIISTACRQNKEWQNQGLPPIRTAINFTSKQLSQPNIIAKIVDILEKEKLDPSCIEIELTENTIIEGTDRIIRTLQELKNIGVRIVIDDFGIGYSNLKYLNLLPIDKIKIDRSFISYISPYPNDVAVILAIISMAKSLNITILAEGVETKEQFDFLYNNDCDEMQGYYYCRPEKPENIIKILRKET